MIEVGKQAPDFVLEDQDGNEVKLEDFKGKKIVIGWHPLAFTSICSDQMRDLDRYYKKMAEKGVDAAIGVSVDAAPAKKVWHDALGIQNVIFLSDFEPKGEMSKAYGIYNEEMGASGRGTVVIEDGKIVYAQEVPIASHPDIEELLNNL